MFMKGQGLVLRCFFENNSEKSMCEKFEFNKKNILLNDKKKK